MKKKEILKTLKNKTEFYDILLENTRDYSGKYKNILIHAPNIYATLCKLLDSKNISESYRNILSSAIAYFILPKDIFPEDIFGTRGYIDDVYLCLFILRKIEKEYEIEEILECWDGGVKTLKKLLNESYVELDKDFHYILKDILSYIGLNRLF